MADLEHLNISFIRDLPQLNWSEGSIELSKFNWIDNLALKLASIDENHDELSIEEVMTAFKNPDKILQSFIKYGVTPENLFRGLRTYLAIRWFNQEKCAGSKPDSICSDIVWTLLALTTRTQLWEMREIVSLIAYFNPQERLTDIIQKKLFFTGENVLMERSSNASKGLCPSDLERLLANHNIFKRGDKRPPKPAHEEPPRGIYKEKIIIDLIKQYKKKGEKNIQAAKILLDTIEKEEKSTLLVTIRAFLRKKKEISEALSLDPDILYDILDTNEGDERFAYSPVANTFGKYIARQLSIIGVADKEAVTRMLPIIAGEGFDSGTKSMMAYSLGKMKFDSADAKRAAALGLYKFLKKTGIKVDKKNIVQRHILESVIALAKLVSTGADGIEMEGVLQLITGYARCKKYPESRLIGGRALGIIGTSPDTAKTHKNDILQILSDLLGDKNQIVANNAYIWYNKVQWSLYNED